MATDNTNKDGNIDDIGSWENLIKFVKEGSIDQIKNSLSDMFKETEKLNNAFLQGRTRLDEMADSISRSAAGVMRLGGSINDVSKTIIQISEGSRRNVIATEEQVSSLYAASRILGKDSKELVETFANVGYETSQIGPNLTDSIKYVQSIGLNAKTVVKDVATNMELMNRFNFSDGVQGLTKMAAQASMLRFEMQNTANFADKVMSPEGAIEAAAGFQRLGVNIGGLVDPFKLMNDSINDPGALQDSIIKATKQYTEFDEKTKSFKINPQGILMLKELSDVTGITTKELSKTALAAADLDRRVSSISPSLNFEKPEDKQLLANMATMKDGEYVVQIKDDQGAIEYKKLGDITAEEFKKLREKQEQEPKTLEEIQISQLGVLKNMETALKSNLAKGMFAAAGTSTIRSNVLRAGRESRTLINSLEESMPKYNKISETVDKNLSEISESLIKKNIGKISDSDLKAYFDKFQEWLGIDMTNYVEKGKEIIKNKKVTGNINVENQTQKNQSDVLTSVENKMSSVKTSMVQKIEPLTTNQILGKRKDLTTTYSETKSTNINGQIDVGGTINIKVEAPAGVSEKDFKIFFDSPEFKRKVYEYYEEKAKELERR